MGRWQILLVVVFLSVRARCGPAAASSEQALPPPPPHGGNSLGDNLVGGAYADCLKKDSASCLKFKLFSLVDRVLAGKDSLRLSEGVTVVRTTAAAAPDTSSGDGAPRSLAEEVRSRGFDEMLASRLEAFLETHSLQVDLKGSDVLGAISSVGRAFNDEEDVNSVGEERGKKKKKLKILLPLLLALKLKAAALIPLALGAIALIAGKALLVGKIALVLSAIIGLRKLLSSQQQKTVTYEIVSQPHHVSSHEGYSSGGLGGGGGGGFSSSDVSYGSSGGGGGHGGWGRSVASAEDAHDMAYKAYAPQS